MNTLYEDFEDNSQSTTPVDAMNDSDDPKLDPGFEHVKNFEELMNRFPEEGPDGIYGILLMGNNDMDAALGMLHYVTMRRKIIAANQCYSSDSSMYESDHESLERKLKMCACKSDDSDEQKLEAMETDDNNSPAEEVVILKPLAETLKKRRKGKAYVIPPPTTLRNTYRDKNSQFVKIVDIK